MGHAGDDPPGQPALSQTGTLPRTGPAAPAGEPARPAQLLTGPAGGAAAARQALAGAAAGTGTVPGPPLARPAPGQDGAAAGRGQVARTHLALLAGYLIAGLAVTWPRVTYLAGRLPATRDAGGYVWDFWWVARQVTHLASPWSTSYLAAPVGTDLSFHTLMPLPGVLMTPVTLVFGPSVTYNLLSVLCPGLLCYVMYRAARLWLPSQLGAVVAGGLFGLSPILAWRSWYEVNLALGALFLPMALEAAVRLRRRPGRRPAVVLGLVLGAAVLTDQESAVLAGIMAALVLVPWLLRRRRLARLRAVGLALLTGALVASPQLIVMIQQAAANRIPAQRAGLLDVDYRASGAGISQLFAPSPRWADYGLTALGHLYYYGPRSVVTITFGVVLSALAVAGVAAAWRRPHGRLLALFWAGCIALSLGSVVWVGSRYYVPAAEVVHGVRLSLIMPFTWFVHIPGLSTFREANRFTELGLVPAALLAGAAVEWLHAHARLALFPVLILALLETGWSGNPGTGTMPTALPALDRPIAAQHNRSIVVDLPFGIRGGLPVIGDGFPPESMVLATADGHPLAEAYVSRIPAGTLAGIQRHPFYAALLHAQGSTHRTTAAQLAVAAADARRMHIGWVLLWRRDHALLRVLRHTGFRLAYRADRVLVFRPAGLAGQRSRAGSAARGSGPASW